jgi:hypothetical protein
MGRGIGFFVRGRWLRLKRSFKPFLNYKFLIYLFIRVIR